MGKFELPIVEKKECGGLTFVIRAIPYSLAKMAQGVGDNPSKGEEFLKAVYERCVDVEGGEKPSIEDMPMSFLDEMVVLSTSKNANFRKPSKK